LLCAWYSTPHRITVVYVRARALIVVVVDDIDRSIADIY
jgi:hypothetical protein